MSIKTIKIIGIIVGIIFALLLVATLFFRFVILPDRVRTECSKTALDFVIDKGKSDSLYHQTEKGNDYQFVYRYCFQKNGLKPE